MGESKETFGRGGKSRWKGVCWGGGASLARCMQGGSKGRGAACSVEAVVGWAAWRLVSNGCLDPESSSMRCKCNLEQVFFLSCCCRRRHCCCCCCFLLLQLERVRKEQGDAAAERCGAGFYYTESATTRHIILALPRAGKHLRCAVLSWVVVKCVFELLLRRDLTHPAPHLHAPHPTPPHPIHRELSF